jgi:hypothetical protein
MLMWMARRISVEHRTKTDGTGRYALRIANRQRNHCDYCDFDNSLRHSIRKNNTREKFAVRRVARDV